MSYQLTLEKAGAIVLGFLMTGSYQGTWGAVVEYNGEKSLVTGSYGSCSYCDAFQSEFGYSLDEPEERDGKYYRGWDDEISKEEYDEYYVELDKKYAEFGSNYLRNTMTKELIQTYISNLNKEDWFDSEEIELYTWALTFFN
jgi:hypothetical protein